MSPCCLPRRAHRLASSAPHCLSTTIHCSSSHSIATVHAQIAYHSCISHCLSRSYSTTNNTTSQFSHHASTSSQEPQDSPNPEPDPISQLTHNNSDEGHEHHSLPFRNFIHQLDHLRANRTKLQSLSLMQKSQLVRSCFHNCSHRDLYLNRGELFTLRTTLQLEEAQLRSMLSAARQQRRDEERFTQRSPDAHKEDSNNEASTHSSSLPQQSQIDSRHPRSKMQSPSYSESSTTTVTQQHKEYLAHWFQENNHAMPTLLQKRQLSSQLGLTQKQVYSQFIALRDKHSARSNRTPSMSMKEAKELLYNWMRTEARLPTHQERTELCHRTHLSMAQLNKQINMFQHSPRPITQKKRNIVRDWLINHNNMKLPNEEQRKELAEQTALSHNQIVEICRRIVKASASSESSPSLTSSKISASIKRKIQVWLEKELDTDPSPHQLQQKAEQLGVAQHQLEQQVRYHLQERTKGSVTEDVRKIVLDWFRNSNYHMPTTEERKLLQAQAHVGPKTLNQLIRNLFVDPSGKLTAEKKEHIAHFLTNNEYHLPDSEQRTQLKMHTQLNSAQLSQCITDYLQQPDHFSNDSWQTLCAWIQDRIKEGKLWAAPHSAAAVPSDSTTVLCSLWHQMHHFDQLYDLLFKNHRFQIHVAIHKYLLSEESEDAKPIRSFLEEYSVLGEKPGAHANMKVDSVVEACSRMIQKEKMSETSTIDSPQDENHFTRDIELEDDRMRAMIQICTGASRRQIISSVRRVMKRHSRSR